MKCSICGREIEEKHGCKSGNNAQPINDGRCCDECDCRIVIPRRLRDAGWPDQQARMVGQLNLKLMKINPADLVSGFEEALRKAGFQTTNENTKDNIT